MFQTEQDPCNPATLYINSFAPSFVVAVVVIVVAVLEAVDIFTFNTTDVAVDVETVFDKVSRTHTQG